MNAGVFCEVKGWARLGALVMLAALAFATGARAEPVAVTFDDLPMLMLRDEPGAAFDATGRLSKALKACRIPATGFVVGEKFQDKPRVRERLLRAWRDAGVELGNHTYSHGSLNTVSPADYVADIARDDALLRRLEPFAAKPVLWFRHPFLETGPTAEARDTVLRWLSEHGYRVAPVTLENDDDLFAAPYEDDLQRGDRRAAAVLRSAYLAFTQVRIAWYRQAAETLLGRRPALVFLMHATRLNADAMPELCRLLHDDGLQPVTLAEALTDPAYQLPEGEPDRNGDDWLNRWAEALGRDLPWDSFPEAPADVRAAAERLDPDTH